MSWRFWLKWGKVMKLSLFLAFLLTVYFIDTNEKLGAGILLSISVSLFFIAGIKEGMRIAR